MLKKKYRLPKGAVFSKSESFSSPFFTLRIKNNKLGNSRFGFIVSKKIDKRAVVRNRIKRLIRSCIEKKLDDVIAGWDALFVIKKEIKDMSGDKICAQTLVILKEKKLIK